MASAGAGSIKEYKIPDTIYVLHLDDDPDFAELTADQLADQDESFSVLTVTSPSEALDTLENRRIDCIVCDYDMPGRNGLEFLIDVRESFPDLPFILFTGKGSEEIASEAISSGVTDYLQKGPGSDVYAVLANRVQNAVSQYWTEKISEEAQIQYRSILEHSSDFVMIVDPNGVISYVSPAVERMMGFTAEELTGTNALEFVHEDDMEVATTALAETVAHPDREISVEFRAEQADGTAKWLEARGFSKLDDPVINGILVNARDITERKEKELELQEQESHYRGILEHSSDFIMIVDVEGKISYVSPAVERMMGYAPAELIGEDAFEMVHEDDRQEATEALAETLADPDQEVSAEVRSEHADGSFRWIEARGSNFLDDPTIEGVMVNVRDITDRKEREEELERFQMMIQLSGDTVYTLDADGNITYVNETFGELTGYAVEHVIGKHVSAVMEERDVERGTEVIRSLLESEEDRGTFEIEIVTADGERIPCESHTALIVEDGEFKGTVGIVRDISQRKRREGLLERQNERLEKFASIVSHDLRNPLTIAKGRADLTNGEDEHLDEVKGALDRMESLIDDTLMLARQGRTVAETEPIQLESLVRRTPEIEPGKISIVVEENLTFQGDPDRLTQVFENLFRNVIDHTEPPTTVRVGEIDGEGFYVEDDGPGIPPKLRDEVFDSRYSDTDDGTGFGLAIVKEIVEAHGWDIGVAESRDGGARFEVTGIDITDPTAN